MRNHFSVDEIARELERISVSTQFRKTYIAISVLRFVVEEALRQSQSGLVPIISEEELTAKVWGQKGCSDDTFRQTMKAVRDGLTNYYSEGGRRDDVIIIIPYGSCTPTLEHRKRSSLSEDFFGKHLNVTQILPDVKFYPLSKVDLKAAEGGQPSNTISLTLEPGSLRLAPPLWNAERHTVDEFIEQLSQAYKKKPDECLRLLFEEQRDYCPFLQEDDVQVDAEPDQLEIINRLRHDSVSLLQDMRMRNIENLLLTHTDSRRPTPAWKEWPKKGGYDYNPLQYNSCNLALLSFEPKMQQYTDFHFRFVRSDYYTYRCLADTSKSFRDQIERKLNDEGLLNYLRHPQIVHSGCGVLVVVCTRDEKLVIRRRSDRCANFKDAHKLAASANEGFRSGRREPTDIKPDGTMKPCIDIVKRALCNELVGWGKGRQFLDGMECYLTGVLVYLENLSVNLCFLAYIDASFRQIEDLALHAPHADEATGEFDEIISKPFTREDICEYVQSTKRGGPSPFAKEWCEGSLVSYYLALRAKE